MVRPSDPFWEHVEKDTGILKCKYCSFVYSAGSSISRVKAHLSGLKGRGVSICTDPPPVVKEAARAEIEGTRERKKQKPGHTDVSDVTCLQQLGEGCSAAEPFEGNRILEFVDSKEDGARYCKFCGYHFEGDSILRVREHLSRIKGLGVSICHSVRDDVMKAARAEIERTRERKRRKTDPDSITDVSDMTDLPRDDDEYKVGDGLAVDPVSVSVQGMEQVPEEGDRSLVVVENIPQPPVRRDLFRNYFSEVDGKLECQFCGVQFAAQTSTTRITMHFSGQAGRGVKSCTCVPDDVKERAIEHVQKKGDRSRTAAENIPQQVPRLVEQDVSFKMLMEDEDDTGRIGLLTEKFVGKAFDENLNKSLTSLRKDDVSCIGIYGMGGIGKTTLAMHIYNRLLENQDPPHRCFWVTVSLDSSIYKLQTLIARAIHLDLPSEVDESIRAAKLHRVLTQMHTTVLVLDDLWNWFDARMVGIPIGPNQCKLIITTRSLNICRQMCCQEIIRLSPLSNEEAWILFTKELGNYSTEVEELAQAVSRQCAGLPLGTRVMARSMKGIFNVHTWRNVLEELKESKVSKGHEMREVFSVLKFSYLRLKDPALQECLLYCALFPKDAKIDRNELIEYMIVEGIIDEGKRRQYELDKGHTMLDTLENACLLEGDTWNVWIHDLIRDMLILELREGSKTLVEAGAQLKELPYVEKWTEKLVRVSLISNNIEVIPSSYTPRCPNVSTLLLCRNRGLKIIADSFFEQFQKLKVLDLSGCVWIEELPRSISDLVNLTALLLRGCRSLIHVPSLAKLEKLKKLDLSHCEWLKQMPEDVKFLLNLKYLDLSGSGIEEIGSGIIPMLSRLQVLKLCNEYGRSKFSIRGSEVGELRMLETLHCILSNVREFGEYMKSRERSQQSPNDYSIFIAREDSAWPTGRKLGSRKHVCVIDNNFIDPLALPTDIEALNIDNCYSTLYKRLFPPSLLASLLNLQEIRVNNWGAIEEIFAMNEGENGEWVFPFSNYSTHSLSKHSLLNLKLIDIRECNKLKKLFPHCLLPNLHNLQKISVGFCNGMEEIFSTDQEEEDGQELLSGQPNLTGLHLSRLTTLKLRSLPELRSIYKGAIICHSLQQLAVVNCPKLKRIPLPLSQPSLQIIQVYPKELWESLHWGEANDKNHLESLCVFKGQLE